MQLLHGPVQPAGGDAKVRLVRRHVVDSVMAPGQDHVVFLEEYHPRRQTEVGVRPLVNLQR